MITPPVKVERFLEALGAPTEFRSAVIGDLAEEFATRVERDGHTGARRWYIREALRASPHLIRDGLRTMRLPDAGRAVGISIASGVATFAICVGFFMIILAISMKLGGIRPALWPMPAKASLILGGLFVCHAAGGAIAAWLSGRGGIVSVLLLGLMSPGIVAILLRLDHSTETLESFLLLSASTIGGVMFGALLQVRGRESATLVSGGKGR